MGTAAVTSKNDDWKDGVTFGFDVLMESKVTETKVMGQVVGKKTEESTNKVALEKFAGRVLVKSGTSVPVKFTGDAGMESCRNTANKIHSLVVTNIATIDKIVFEPTGKTILDPCLCDNVADAFAKSQDASKYSSKDCGPPTEKQLEELKKNKDKDKKVFKGWISL